LLIFNAPVDLIAPSLRASILDDDARRSLTEPISDLLDFLDHSAPADEADAAWFRQAGRLLQEAVQKREEAEAEVAKF
jgi:hypothetical protein